MALSPRQFAFMIQEDERGMRLDLVLSHHIEDCSRSYAAHLIQRGDVTINGQSGKPSLRVRLGDTIEGRLPVPAPSECKPEPIDLCVLYEDPCLIVINKPPGLVVHPAPGHASGTLVNALLHHCPDLAAFGGEIRPGIVHRLDKDTSGALVVAKTPAIHEKLSLQFKRRTVRKVYLAIVQGEMETLQGKIELPIGRHPTDRKKMSTMAAKARAAETRYRVRERLHGASLLELDLKTGRTHQIRVHCAALHHPLVGDPVYGGRQGRQILALKAIGPGAESAAMTVTRQMLHAWQLGFVHPQSGRWLQLEAEMPCDMMRLLTMLRRGPAGETGGADTKSPENH